MVISTWGHGMPANAEAWKILNRNGAAIDAVEKGVNIIEADPDVRSVGIGAYPDHEGNITLDASIMDHRQKAGSVAFLQHILHPVSVARKVMEKTPHVMLVGEGALHFAIQQGFMKQNLLTPEALSEWEQKFKNNQEPEINIENHDTIGMLAVDNNGNLAGSCTTSGTANKLYGRVGDSPIIGAGLFVDNEVGAACATGLGEAVIRHAGSAMVVELMRQGYDPMGACEEVVNRIVKTHQDNLENLQVGFLALAKDGATGAYAIKPGFNYALRTSDQNELLDANAAIN